MTPIGRPTFRFAPSPNGELHLGQAYSALVGFTRARDYGGRFLVRIEDIDIARTRPEFVQGIFEDLAWLGIVWEEPVLRQSTRFAAYRAAADALAHRGLLYPCFATRSEILAQASGRFDPDGAPFYPGLWRGADPAAVADRLARGEVPAWRLDMAKALAEAALRGVLPILFTETGSPGRTLTAEPERWGDAVLMRKDVPASYHLAVVVDDAAQGVTHVTRGRDLFATTDLHRLLQALLDLPAPLYHHHDLVTDDQGRKLSKSAGDASLRSLRRGGLTATELWDRFGFRR